MSDLLAFERQVVDWVRDAIAGEPRAFGALVSALPGIDPIVVADALKKLPAVQQRRVTWEPIPDSSMPWRELPVPHPLDFDWRFTVQTADSLLSDLMSVGNDVVLLGAPTLWRRAESLGNGTVPHLIDINPILQSADISPEARQRLHLCDLLCDPLPSLSADVIFADPPWYPEAIRSFLWAAFVLLRPSGVALVSLPSAGTRPGIVDEISALVTWADRIGLHLVSRRDAALRYTSPPFERNVLAVHGLLPFVPRDWRSSNLFTFRRAAAAPRPERPTPVAIPPPWVERSLAGVRIRIDAIGSSLSGDPSLIPLIKGDVLPSFSRRDPRRDAARVWTSGNRIFGCSAPAVLADLLSLISIDATSTSIERFARARGLRSEAIEATAATVAELVRRERSEYLSP